MRIYFLDNYSKKKKCLTNSQTLVINKWISKVALIEKVSIKYVNYIFCSDEYLYGVNLKFLNHDTYTDVITFSYSNGTKRPIESDIYISLDRIEENSKALNNSFMEELLLVIMHSFLHSIGYDDCTDDQKVNMRFLENKYLSLYFCDL